MAINLAPYYQVTLNGAYLPENMLKYIEEIEVEDTGTKTSIARITVLDHDEVWINDQGIVKGNIIEIIMGTMSHYRTTFVGNISFIEADYPVDGLNILVVSALANEKHPTPPSRPIPLVRKLGDGDTQIKSFKPTVREKEVES